MESVTFPEEICGINDQNSLKTNKTKYPEDENFREGNVLFHPKPSEQQETTNFVLSFVDDNIRDINGFYDTKPLEHLETKCFVDENNDKDIRDENGFLETNPSDDEGKKEFLDVNKDKSILNSHGFIDTKVSEHEETNESVYTNDEENIRKLLLEAEEDVVRLRNTLNLKLQLIEGLKLQLGINTITKMQSDVINIANAKHSTIKQQDSDNKSNVKKTISTVYCDTPKTKIVKKDKNTFQPGDKIFAKVKGFVHWPSRVNPLPSDIEISPNKIPIFFFGTHEVFFILPTSCWAYDEYTKKRWGQPRSRAKFNQALDEIENNPTLFQYGADPMAEDFLSQFFVFRRSDGEMSAGIKTNVKFCIDDNKSTKSIKSAAKTRHPSGSSFSTNASKVVDSVKTEIEDTEIKDLFNDGSKTIDSKENVATNAKEENEKNVKKRERSGSCASTKLVDNKMSTSYDNEGLEIDIKSKIKIDDTTEIRKTRHSSGSSLTLNKIEDEKTSKPEPENSMPIESVQGNDMNINDSTKSIKAIKNSSNKKSRKGRKVTCSSLNNNDGKLETGAIKPIPKTNEVKHKVTLLKELKYLCSVSEDMPKLRSRSISKSQSVERINDVKDPNDNSKEVAKKNVKKRNSSRSSIDKSDNVRIESEAGEVPTTNDVPEKDNSIFEITPLPADNNNGILHLRSKSVSISKSTTKRKSSVTKVPKKSEDAEDSDHRKDEDFQPSSKTAKKHTVKPKTTRKSDPIPKTKSNTTTKVNKSKKLVSDDDSLSSISSIEHSNEKEKTISKEDLRVRLPTNEVLIENSEVKTESQPERKKSNSQSSVVEENHCNELMICSDISVVPYNGANNESFAGNEVIVEISIPDIGKSDKALFESNDNSHIIMDNSVFECEESSKIDDSEMKTQNDVIEAIHKTLVTESTKGSEEAVKSNKLITKVSKKPKTVNRKRKRIDFSESDDDVISHGKKKRKLSESIDEDFDNEMSEKEGNSRDKKKKKKISQVVDGDSDIEMLSVEEPTKPPSMSPVSLKKMSSVDSSVMEPKIERIKALQAFNSDIKSSLVLGHEDYIKCRDRFRSLCTMEIDLMSLVSVWQLMDTVKKCRRYKRNESIMAEAQIVYKRFMDIYSHSTLDEVHRAQTVLSQCRINVGAKSDHNAQNPSVPTSVDEMFHHNRPSTLGNNNTNNSGTQKTSINNNNLITDNNEEKMRLLSADLEAKVSDILNKIEKNTVQNNAINISSRHTAPSRTEQWVLGLPEKYEGNSDRGKDKDEDSDDEDDVEAIVKRIESVPINNMEDGDDEEEDEVMAGENEYNRDSHHRSQSHHQHNSSGSINIGGSSGGMATSALDARIENIFNRGLKEKVTVKNSTSMSNRRQSHTSSLSRNHGHRTSRDSSSFRHSTNPAPITLSPPHKPTIERIVTKEPLASKIIDIVKSPVPAPGPPASTDNSIYDLLGV